MKLQEGHLQNIRWSKSRQAISNKYMSAKNVSRNVGDNGRTESIQALNPPTLTEKFESRRKRRDDENLK